MTAKRCAGAAWVVCVVAALATVVLLVLGIGDSTPGDGFGLGGWGGLSFTIAALSFGTVGAVVATRLPRNRIGWVFCTAGLACGTGTLAYQYGDQALYGSAQGVPGGDVAAWFQNVAITPTFGLLGLALLLFPDGRPPAGWRLAVVPSVAGCVLVSLSYALRGGTLDDPFETVMNPFGIPGTFEVFDTLSGLGWLLMGIGVGVAAFATRSRMRRAGPVERQQMKWIRFAAVVAGVVIVSDVVSFFIGIEGINGIRIVALGMGFSIFPVAAGIAILRYRLYDIDVVINRTIVYGSLTALLAATYLGSVLLLQLALEPFTAGSGLAVAASTLAAAALVRPARARIQRAVDRRFFRHKYDAARILEAFGARLREEVDLDALTVELRDVVLSTMQPAHVSLWVAHADGGS